MTGEASHWKMRCCHYEPTVVTPEKDLGFIVRVCHKDCGPKRPTNFWKLFLFIIFPNRCYLCKECAVLVDAFQEGNNGVHKAF